MHIAYTPPDARQRSAATVRAFFLALDAMQQPTRPMPWRLPHLGKFIREAWRHVRLVPANDP